MIRSATGADVPRLVAMGLALRRSEPTLRASLTEHPDRVEALMASLVRGEASDVLVVERDGAVVGMLALLAYVQPMSGQRVASEVTFWLDPAHRGGGVALLRAGEAWARDHQCEALEVGAPNARVDRFYERLGYAAVERRYRKPLRPPVQRVDVGDDQIVVLDGVLDDPAGYRAEALAGGFTDVQMGPDLFRGIRLAPPRVGDWLRTQVPTTVPTLSFFRQSPAGQPEPTYVHSDVALGQWTGILYLTPEPPEGDGTAFYRHRDGAHAASLADLPRYAAAFDDDDDWVRWLTVPAVFNRLVLFPASYFHARALRDNYGTGEHARLIQALFGGYVDASSGPRDCGRTDSRECGLRGEEERQGECRRAATPNAGGGTVHADPA